MRQERQGQAALQQEEARARLRPRARLQAEARLQAPSVHIASDPAHRSSPSGRPQAHLSRGRFGRCFGDGGNGRGSGSSRSRRDAALRELALPALWSGV